MADIFYTNAGCTLVALNPFKPVPQLYLPELMKEYHAAPQPQVRFSYFLGLRAPLPHLLPLYPTASSHLGLLAASLSLSINSLLCSYSKPAGAKALPTKISKNFGHMTVIQSGR